MLESCCSIIVTGTDHSPNIGLLMQPFKGMTLENYDQLVEGLKTWCNFAEHVNYDQVGMFELFCACIENMHKHMHEDVIEELGETLTPEERKFLTRLLQKR